MCRPLWRLVAIALLASAAEARANNDFNIYGFFPADSTPSTPPVPSAPTTSTSPTSPTSNLRSGDSGCTAPPVDLTTVSLPSGSRSKRFYDEVQRTASQREPPTFYGRHQRLCEADKGYEWAYCLPITGRKDSPFCENADRLDLLKARGPHARCYASVLHMLLVDVYEELEQVNAKPALLYGSLLGAIRNEATIPFTEDADIGYQLSSGANMFALRRRLAARGYHMFYSSIWRVCVAPTHPLAAALYDSSKLITTDCCTVPYVDLYSMTRLTASAWTIEFAVQNPIPDEQIEPYSRVRMHSQTFDTVADPFTFLTREYGPNYRIPKPRQAFR